VLIISNGVRLTILIVEHLSRLLILLDNLQKYLENLICRFWNVHKKIILTSKDILITLIPMLKKPLFLAISCKSLIFKRIVFIKLSKIPIWY
jgi:hypothetical protein